jgi:hypothetical protein
MTFTYPAGATTARCSLASHDGRHYAQMAMDGTCTSPGPPLTIDLVAAYHRANASPMLALFLSRLGARKLYEDFETTFAEIDNDLTRLEAARPLCAKPGHADRVATRK